MGEVVDLFSKKKVSARCMSCGDVHSCIVDADAWNWYANSNGRLVQDIFPHEDTWTREILIAGRLDLGIQGRCSLYVCKKCCDEWEQMEE